MKRALLGAAVVALGLATAPAADAAVFTADFCDPVPDTTCPTGVTEASLTFEDIADSDTNNYKLTIRITDDGNTAFDFIDAVSFSIDGIQTPAGYGGKPTLTNSPSLPVGESWGVYWENVSNSTAACASDTNSSQEVCVGSDPNAVSPGAAMGTGGVPKTNTWVLTVDLAGSGIGATQLSTSSVVNLRAHFLEGPCQPNQQQGQNLVLSCAGQTILSPRVHENLDTTGPPNDTSQPVVPEPALLSLLGLGLVGTATRLRKKA